MQWPTADETESVIKQLRCAPIEVFRAPDFSVTRRMNFEWYAKVSIIEKMQVPIA